MATEIRPSLAQMLNPQAAAPAATPRPQAAQGGFASAMAAQKAFFNQITTPQVTPPTYTAADVARATAAPQATQKTAPAQAADPNQPLRRPGSYLNIVV
ncbi:hypothetical protein [Asticcacaulis solisilvae]|uniref:hypothetical protein n=1 Tax=Asticcacaulis solisilvae TaxID=1217274 RepID=UPI003FD81CB6